jgi:hypothetical protein
MGDAFTAPVGIAGVVMPHRPQIVTEFSRTVYGFRFDNPRLFKAIEALGWQASPNILREWPPACCLWWRLDDVEVSLVYGGPLKLVSTFSWRAIGGPAQRL